MSIPSQSRFQIHKSRSFDDWMMGIDGSILFSTYQAGKIFVVGDNGGDTASACELQFPRSMGIAISEDRKQIYLATQHQVYRLDDFMASGEVTAEGCDAVFVPRVSWMTGDLDIHDMVVSSQGRPIFVNTLFNCLATVSDGFSFKPIWRPPFINGLFAEDRCHLNGLASVSGEPRYVSAVSTSNVLNGWRAERTDGGVLIDIATSEIVSSGFSMPHSPRFYRDKLWCLNSGKGEFGFVNELSGEFEKVAVLPGYARGLSFVDKYAIIGLSLPREGGVFSGLPLEETIEKYKLNPICGVLAVDLDTGLVAASLKIEGAIRELYDTAVLLGRKAPRILGYRTDEIRKMISIDRE